jgi:hypothetical protein
MDCERKRRKVIGGSAFWENSILRKRRKKALVPRMYSIALYLKNARPEKTLDNYSWLMYYELSIDNSFGCIHLVQSRSGRIASSAFFISVYLSIVFFESFEKRYADAAAIPKIISGTASTRDSKVRALQINKHRYEAD